MKTFSTKRIVTAAVAVVLLAASAALAGDTKTPNQNLPVPKRPQPASGSSLLGLNLNTKTQNDIKEFGNPGGSATGGLTISHGGNPPKSPDSGGGFQVTFGGNPPRGDSGKSSNKHDWDWYHKHHHIFSTPFVEEIRVVEVRIFEPLHSSIVVLPGDNLLTISLREYGSSHVLSIAEFNSLPWNASLVPGQVLALPVIGPNRVLSVSRAPTAIPVETVSVE